MPGRSRSLTTETVSMKPPSWLARPVASKMRFRVPALMREKLRVKRAQPDRVLLGWLSSSR